MREWSIMRVCTSNSRVENITNLGQPRDTLQCHDGSFLPFFDEHRTQTSLTLEPKCPKRVLWMVLSNATITTRYLEV